MKKNNNAMVYINLSVEGEMQKLHFETEQLRNWINKQRIVSGQDTVNFTFDYNGKTYSEDFKIDTEFAIIKKVVKYAELYTNIIPHALNKYVVDLTKRISQKKISPKIGREHEIEKAWFYLSQKTRNNVFLIGPKDVGKTTIAYEITRQIATNECPREFYEKRVLVLKPELLLKIERESMYKKKVEQLITFLVKNRDKIILFVDKAIYLKTDVMLIYLLYACLKKYNIPIITTSSEDNFDDYFYEDQSIAKYINYIYVDEPEIEEVEPMIRCHIKKLQKQYGIKISKEMIKFGIFTSVLNSSVSANPGNVINVFERAFLEAKRKDKEIIDKRSILSCYNTHLKEYKKMSDEEKKTTSYHETGHYIVAIKSKYKKDTKISCVSNLPMNWWLGVTMSYTDSKEYVVYSKEYFVDHIAFLLGGRIAEKKFTNLDSVGAASDLERANETARAMVMNWGLSEKSHNHNRQYELQDYYLMPESKKELIDKEIQELIDEGTKRAEEIIEENEELLKIIAEKILLEEILTGEQLKAICDEYDKNKNNK